MHSNQFNTSEVNFLNLTLAVTKYVQVLQLVDFVYYDLLMTLRCSKSF